MQNKITIVVAGHELSVEIDSNILESIEEDLEEREELNVEDGLSALEARKRLSVFAKKFIDSLKFSTINLDTGEDHDLFDESPADLFMTADEGFKEAAVLLFFGAEVHIPAVVHYVGPDEGDTATILGDGIHSLDLSEYDYEDTSSYQTLVEDKIKSLLNEEQSFLTVLIHPSPIEDSEEDDEDCEFEGRDYVDDEEEEDGSESDDTPTKH